MRLARYVGEGRVEIREEPAPACPAGGLLVQTEASGLCSGELMAWYMDQKIPHVLGHELSGRVIESEDARFPVGARVSPHHHAPCMQCDLCLRGAYVHCAQWKRTKLVPGGLAEVVAVGAENLNDCARTDDLSAEAAALMEPLACVAKSLRRARVSPEDRVAVIGTGVMGLMHLLAHRGSVGFDLNPRRREWATAQGLDVRAELDGEFDVVIVCPGTDEAVASAIRITRPQGRVLLFSPLAPPARFDLDFNAVYFRDFELIASYSCGPNDTAQALEWLREGRVRPEQVVSHFIGFDELPAAYLAMRQGEILKPMVIFRQQ